MLSSWLFSGLGFLLAAEQARSDTVSLFSKISPFPAISYHSSDGISLLTIKKDHGTNLQGPFNFFSHLSSALNSHLCLLPRATLTRQLSNSATPGVLLEPVLGRPHVSTGSHVAQLRSSCWTRSARPGASLGLSLLPSPESSTMPAMLENYLRVSEWRAKESKRELEWETERASEREIPVSSASSVLALPDFSVVRTAGSCVFSMVGS